MHHPTPPLNQCAKSGKHVFMVWNISRLPVVEATIPSERDEFIGTNGCDYVPGLECFSARTNVLDARVTDAMQIAEPYERVRGMPLFF